MSISDQIGVWLREQRTAAGAEGFVFGLSGGVDSATSAALAVRAVGSERVLAALMPCHSQPEDARLARLVARPLWGRVVRRPDERWRWVRLALVLLGVAGVIVALARPQWGIVREKVEREGVDVVLALDTSGSMDKVASGDSRPKYQVARSAIQEMLNATDEFVARRPDFPIKIALYHFSSGDLVGYVFRQYPYLAHFTIHLRFRKLKEE